MSMRSMVRVVAGLVVLSAGTVLMAIAQPAKSTGKAGEPTAPPTPTDARDSKEKLTLAVGDPAPALDVDAWVKGDAIKSFESGKVYVVEFWATWCAPCVRAIPHLSELQRKNDKVTVIAIAASERRDSDGSDNRLDNLKKFVEKQGDKMGYRVAYDADRGMANAWLTAAGRTSIPTAFIVDHHTKIAWVGHPNKLGPELEKVLDSGTLRGKDVKPSDER